MTVSFYATLRRIVGSKHVDMGPLEGMTINALVDRVVAQFPDLAPEILDEAGRLSRHVHVFINGRGAQWLPDRFETRIDASQTIEFFPAVAGG
jgi:molybdopterin synthase sulfur carrier subunit